MVDNFSYDTSQVVTCTSTDYVELSITKCVGKGASLPLFIEPAPALSSAISFSDPSHMLALHREVNISDYDLITNELIKK